MTEKEPVKVAIVDQWGFGGLYEVTEDVYEKYLNEEINLDQIEELSKLITTFDDVFYEGVH